MATNHIEAITELNKIINCGSTEENIQGIINAISKIILHNKLQLIARYNIYKIINTKCALEIYLDNVNINNYDTVTISFIQNMLIKTIEYNIEDSFWLLLNFCIKNSITNLKIKIRPYLVTPKVIILNCLSKMF